MFQQNLREEGVGHDLDPQEVVSRSTDVMGQGRNLTAGKGNPDTVQGEHGSKTGPPSNAPSVTENLGPQIVSGCTC